MNAKRASPPILAVALAIALVACGGGEAQDDSLKHDSVTATETASPISTPPVHTAAPDAQGLSIPPALNSVRSILEATPFVVVGRVEQGSELIYIEEVPGDPCPRPGTIFNVRPEQVIHDGGFEIPSVLPVLLAIGPEPENCVSIDRGKVAPLETGVAYLFFLRDENSFGLPGYAGYNEARFRLTDDARIVPNGSESQLPGPAAISGITPDQAEAAVKSSDPAAALTALAHVTVDEATEKILAAIAEAPLPMESDEQSPEETSAP